MRKNSSVTDKIMTEFAKKETIRLDELYSILSKDDELEPIRHALKHRIRSSVYNLKKQGRLELISKSTYRIT